jgi:hypothetical protein
MDERAAAKLHAVRYSIGCIKASQAISDSLAAKVLAKQLPVLKRREEHLQQTLSTSGLLHAATASPRRPTTSGGIVACTTRYTLDLPPASCACRVCKRRCWRLMRVW